MTAADHLDQSRTDAVRCRVVGGEQLPPESGGAAAICAAIDRAMAARCPGRGFRAEVTVTSPSGLICRLAVAGRDLPEQKISAMDRPIMRSTVERFAKSLAEQAAELLGE